MERYIVDGDLDSPYSLEELQELAEEWLDNNHDAYDDWLDELGDVEIGGYKYSQSIALKRVDPIAYNVGFSDWTSGELEDFTYNVESLQWGENLEFLGYIIEVYEEDD